MYAVVGTDGVVYGPVSIPMLFEWVAQGRVVAATELIDPQGRRLYAANAPELQHAFRPAPAPTYGMPMAYWPTKSKRKALAYAFFLGFAGAHRLYLGHRGSGFAMLALNAAALFYITNIERAFFLGIVATIWLIVDMAMIASGTLKAADGSALG